MSSKNDKYASKRPKLSLAGRLTALYLMTMLSIFAILFIKFHGDYLDLQDTFRHLHALQLHIMQAHLESKLDMNLPLINPHMMLGCMQRLIASILLLLGISGVGGYFIIKKVMNRIFELSLSMQAIDRAKLGTRIDKRDWPKELRPLACSFNDMLERLEESFEQLSRFSSNIAHELRTPLNNLRTITEVTLAKSRPPEEYQDVMEQIGLECENLSKLTENLLFLARAERGMTPVTLVHSSLRDEVARLIEFYGHAAEEKQIRLSVTGDSMAHFDMTLLPRVIGNLLSNAIRHTPAGGTIDISIDESPEGESIVSVRDTGEGIPESHQDKVFQRFHRVDSSRTLESGGTGLGLSIARCIMRLHGGDIALISKHHQGTTVTLRLPLYA